MNLVQLLLIITSLSTFSGVATADGKAAADIGPAEVILRSPATIKSVKFPHRQHQDRSACGECHHSRNDKGVKIPYTEDMHIQKCVVCHNKENMVSPKLNSFKLVAHWFCKECHKKNRDIAPTKCSGCHTKDLEE